MTTKQIALVLVVMVILGIALRVSARQDESVPYPTGYRQWPHVKSTLVGPESQAFKTNGGLHHFYANERGMEGYRTGKFPDGSILIDDLLDTQAGKAPGTTGEGARKRLAVMVRDEKRYAATGGWGFEVFKADTQTGSLAAAGRTACFDCHQTAGPSLVFSEVRK